MVDDGRDPPDVDLVAAGSTLTEAKLAEIRALTTGQLHTPVAPERLDALGIPLMIESEANPGARSAAFTVTVDLADQAPQPGSLPGVVGTIRALADPSHDAAAFRKPGHVAPLRGRSGGVLRRFGHTEAAIDLARLAELPPVAVLTALHTAEGRAARPEDALELLEGRDIPSIAISEIVRLPPAQRARGDPRRRSGAADGRRDLSRDRLSRHHDERGPRRTGEGRRRRGKPAIGSGAFRVPHRRRVRLAAVRLRRTTRRRDAAHRGRGPAAWCSTCARRDGGSGSPTKLHAYELQDGGLDTVEANHHLGFAVDLRDYGVGAQILRELGLRELRLLTNNPKKTEGFRAYGLHVGRANSAHRRAGGA